MGSFTKCSVLLPILILIFKSDPTQADNILVYCAVGSYSQRISIWPLVEGLIEKGHNVTFLSAYDSKDPNPKVHDYAPKSWKGLNWEERMSFFDIRKEGKMVGMWFQIPNLGIASCEALFADREFIDWVKSSKFDLVIMDALMNECALSLVHYWKTKLIIYGTSTNYGWFYDQFGLPDETSSVSDLMYNFPRGKEMKFWQRFVNALTPLYWKYLRETWYLPKLEEISRKGLELAENEMPSFIEIERNASFVMLTTHFSLEPPKSMPPNAIMIQGITVDKKMKPLPKEMADFINKSAEGFVYISFGTVAEFVNFDKETQDAFINALRQFPNLRFIWKSSFPIKAELPEWVMVTQWAPQQTLLAHPKIKAFISHTGMGSSTELIHFAVPVICLPVLAEQDLNAHGIASKGAGILLEITTLKEHELVDALNEVIYNPKYKKSMERLSRIFKDRPVTPLDEAVWWTEYVLRHDNPHEILRPPSVEQTWWVKRQIDVWLAATGIVLILIGTIVYALCAVLRRIFRLGFGSETMRKVKLN